MKLGLLTPYNRERLIRAEKIGLRKLQLRLGPGFPLQIDNGGINEVKWAAEELQKRGFEVGAIGYYRNMLVTDEKQREAESRRLRKIFIIATEVLPVPAIGVFAGRVPELSVEENIPHFVKVWKPLAKEAEDLGLKLAFENCTMYRDYPIQGLNMSYSPSAYEQMFDAVDSPALGIEFDPSHCTKQMIDPLKFMKQFSGRIHHFHAKDHERLEENVYQYGCFDTRCSRDRFPGLGQVPFKEIIKELCRQGYTGQITIEAERDPSVNNEQETVAALTKSRKYLEEIISKIK